MIQSRIIKVQNSTSVNTTLLKCLLATTKLRYKTKRIFSIQSQRPFFNLLLGKAEPDISGTMLSADIGQRLSDAAIYTVYKEKVR